MHTLPQLKLAKVELLAFKDKSATNSKTYKLDFTDETGLKKYFFYVTNPVQNFTTEVGNYFDVAFDVEAKQKAKIGKSGAFIAEEMKIAFVGAYPTK